MLKSVEPLIPCLPCPLVLVCFWWGSRKCLPSAICCQLEVQPVDADTRLSPALFFAPSESFQPFSLSSVFNSLSFWPLLFHTSHSDPTNTSFGWPASLAQVLASLALCALLNRLISRRLPRVLRVLSPRKDSNWRCICRARFLTHHSLL